MRGIITFYFIFLRKKLLRMVTLLISSNFHVRIMCSIGSIPPLHLRQEEKREIES